MKRAQLQHVLRAAASIVELSDLVVIGSQAILASFPEWELPPEATASVEADLAVDATLARVDLAVDESALADRIDGAIGEGSMFHQTHGYYAQGVETTTAVLTEGWRDRLVPFVCEDAEPKVVGWCLERHDLWVAKAAASREKDREFCVASTAPHNAVTAESPHDRRSSGGRTLGTEDALVRPPWSGPTVVGVLVFLLALLLQRRVAAIRFSGGESSANDGVHLDP